MSTFPTSAGFPGSTAFPPYNPFNATVPSNASIQPPQAFVDYTVSNINNGNFFSGVHILNDLNGLSATSVLGMAQAFYFGQGAISEINASDNALLVTDVNAILAFYVLHKSEPYDSTIINLSGGTNAAPTGQGLTDKATLILDGWTVMTT